MQNKPNVTKTFTPDETARWLAGLDKRFGSAEVWCETADGQLLIVKSPYKHFWSVPGGIIDAGETPKQAAVREVQEEVGITLDPDQLQFRMVVDRVLGALGQNYQFIFHAQISQQQIDQMTLQADEIIDSGFVARHDVRPNDAASERALGATIYDWANGVTGYSEKIFSPPVDVDDA